MPVRGFQLSEDHAVVRNQIPQSGVGQWFGRSWSICLDPPESQHFLPGLGYSWPPPLQGYSKDPTGCTSQVLGSFCWTALGSCGLFWLLLFLHIECTEDSHTGSLAGCDRLGQEWQNDAAVNCNEQFGDPIVLQVSLEPHRDFVCLELDRSGLLMSSRWLPSPFCHPLVSSVRLASGYFIIVQSRNMGDSQRKKIYLCHWPGRGPLETSDLFTKANFDLWELPSVSESRDSYFSSFLFLIAGGN